MGPLWGRGGVEAGACLLVYRVSPKKKWKPWVVCEQAFEGNPHSQPQGAPRMLSCLLRSHDCLGPTEENLREGSGVKVIVGKWAWMPLTIILS